MPIIEKWLGHAERNHSNIDIPLLKKACDFVSNHQGDTKIPYAESLLLQGIQIGEILLELNCDKEIITAGVLYPIFYYKKITKDMIINQFSTNTYKLLSGVERMESIHAITKSRPETSLNKAQLDNLRKMLLAIVDDVHIVLIKLAERLAVLKYLKHLTADYQKPIANQGMTIYAPLANQLGIGQLKWQIEDLSFRYMNPDQYQLISKELKTRRKDRDHFIHEMEIKLSEIIKKSNIEPIALSGRSKHIYSIYRKMSRKEVEFSQIYDTSAIRILVPTLKDCYTTLSIIHTNWEHIPQEFDDYIAKPKPNGYRSIHTVIAGPNHVNVEIQIRTFKMHEEAELGIAAHWKYKENIATQSTYEDKINLLRKMMDWQIQVSNKDEKDNHLYADLFKDRIYVFSPNGDIYDLEANATPLDFAYHIHSSVGHRCRGAKVNAKLVPLTHPLQTGDQVEILTSKEEKPSRDWLNPNLGYIKSKHALSKIRHWFKKELFEQNLSAGQAIWEKISKKENIPKSKLAKIINRLNYKSVDDVIAGLGAGDISASIILNQLKEKEIGTDLTKTSLEKSIKKKEKSPTSKFIIEGVGNLLTQLARCCKPIPGDSIVGYITKGRGVTIHQADCYNIKKMLTSGLHRMIEVRWGQTTPVNYVVDLMIEGEDRAGLLRDITNVIANENVSLLGINSRVNKLDNLAIIYLTIEVKNDQPLKKILSAIRQIPDIIAVNRR